MRRLHPLDSLLIKLLGKQGLLKREALTYLHRKVLRLTREEIQRVKQLETHAGFKAKETYVQKLLAQKRETLFVQLSQQLNYSLSHQDTST